MEIGLPVQWVKCAAHGLRGLHGGVAYTDIHCMNIAQVLLFLLFD